MAFLIHRIAVIRVEVCAEDVVDDAVVVIILPITGDFPRVFPHVGSKSRVTVIHAGVAYRHQGFPGSG